MLSDYTPTIDLSPRPDPRDRAAVIAVVTLLVTKDRLDECQETVRLFEAAYVRAPKIELCRSWHGELTQPRAVELGLWHFSVQVPMALMGPLLRAYGYDF